MLAQDLDQIDLADIGFYARPFRERDVAYRVLRDQAPVTFFQERPFPPLPPGPGFWAVTRHADVAEVCRNADVFAMGRQFITADVPIDSRFDFLRSFFDMDGRDHAVRRRLLTRRFSQNAVQTMTERIEQTIHHLLDDVVERGECDFATDIAGRLPLAVVCDMLGIPESDRAWIKERTMFVYSSEDPEIISNTELGAVAMVTAATEIGHYGIELATRRRAEPTDDIMSLLAHATIDGQPLADVELGQYFALLISAANETTGHTLSKGLLAFIEFPEQRRLWESQFDDLTPRAVEEVLRWASPIVMFRRTTTRAVELGGVTLDAGAKVLPIFPAANRDERAFAEPDTFDITRDHNPHFAFSGPGVHQCSGMNLARLEIRVVFKALFERLRDLELAGEPRVLRSDIMAGITHLPIRFRAASRRGL